jgi:hypothetical protein
MRGSSLGWLGFTFLLALFASTASAAPIGPSCGTCQGSIYDLTYDPDPVATTATSETWRITLSIDTAGYNGPGVYLNTVAIKVASDFLNANLVSAPGGLSQWSEIAGGLAAAGCTGSGSGFDCVAFHASISLAPAVPGATYAWVFDVELASGALFTGSGESSVKARYVTATGSKAGALVSEGITLSNVPSVPEPGSLALLSLVGAALALVERARASR